MRPRGLAEKAGLVSRGPRCLKRGKDRFKEWGLLRRWGGGSEAALLPTRLSLGPRDGPFSSPPSPRGGRLAGGRGPSVGER